MSDDTFSHFIMQCVDPQLLLLIMKIGQRYFSSYVIVLTAVPRYFCFQLQVLIKKWLSNLFYLKNKYLF